MTNTTKKNLRKWVEDNLDYFPQGYTVEDYDSMSTLHQEMVLKRLLKAFNSRKSGRSGSYRNTYDTLSTNDIKVIDPTDITFTVQLTKILEKTVERRVKIATALARHDEKVEWNELPTPLKNNFKNWVTKNAKRYDKEFKGSYFPELPDEIKVEWLFLLAKKFGYKFQEDMLDAKISVADMVSGVKTLIITQEIQDAIDDVIPVTSLLQKVKRSDMDGWDGKSASEFAKGMKQEEIKALRDGRKADKKRAKLLARARTTKALEGYTTMFQDPMFDRDMFNIILNRMDKGTAFEDTWRSNDSKTILKMLVTHPMATTSDLKRINKMRDTGWNKSPRYASNHLNHALSKRTDLPENELMQLVKKAQTDVKIEASKRKLSPTNREILLDYTVKHHAHMPDQLKEIFSNAKADYNDYKDQIITGMYKKYQEKNWQANGLKTLEVIDAYDWLDDMPERYKANIAKTIVQAYDRKSVTKERLVKVIHSLSSSGMNYLTELYDATGEDDFLPKEVQDIFIF